MVLTHRHPHFGPIKLGKLSPRLDPRTFKLSKYLKLPDPPAEVSWIVEVKNWPMFLNDNLGDCVIAAAGHMIEQWNFYAGHPAQPTDNQILRAYEDVGGYRPGHPDTDNGCDMLTSLKYWRTTGIGGHKILAFVSVDPTNLSEVRQAIQLFGNLYVGMALPNSAQEQQAWTVAEGGTNTDQGSPGGWGGHCIPLLASSPMTHTCITWGAPLKMSHNFFKDYVDECYVVLSPEWLEKNGLAPSSFDLAQLQADLAAL